MLKRIILFGIFSLISYLIKAQGEINDQTILQLGDEKSYAFSLYSNGWGLDYRFGKRLDFFKKTNYEIIFSAIKNPKEQKQTSINPYTFKKFVYGKQNYAFALRFGYGFQKEIFSKYDKGGISIKYFYSVGPSVGFYKPVYYVLSSYQVSTFDTVLIHMAQDIFDRKSFFYKFYETRVIPGAFGKFGFQFEYSKNDKFINGLECGIMLEAFTKKIPIMSYDYNNKQFFFVLFVNYRIGNITDPYLKKRRSEIKKYLEETL
jgi:hypothetical protein